ncbi:divisome protein SepX/GlpR [Kutzneria chonburiensis]|uniref:Gephyrin-like molybdotransferase receptor GlpR n=1 Tax=Kutzneria chonburiensis TaxID=1483604 RepID=A0ABV6N5A7_9PSEU|nr:gephyrin-like molybdotransferase receptor GlpR [Kutzneria chonburiensis]
MPSSLIIVALVVAWLVVLVPMIARKRAEVAKTSDSALAARVLHGGTEDVEEEIDMNVDESETAITDDDYRDYEDTPRRYRPGRGGYDPEAAATAARAKYAFRQRMVLLLLVLSVLSALFAGLVMPIVWWGHGGVDLLLVGYLVYLRRQVRIENDVRERRQARMRGRDADEAEFVETEYDDEAEYDDYAPAETVAAPVDTAPVEPELSEYEDAPRSTPARAPYRPGPTLNGTVVVDIDDEDPAFEDLDLPHRRGYRRVAG